MTRKREEPWLEWLAGIVALRLIKWVGRRARSRGDLHEAAHCDAAILAGNSHHAEPYAKCSLPFTKDAMERYRRSFEDGRQ